MAKKFRPVWGERRAPEGSRPTPEPAAASGAADAESGHDAGDAPQALRALEIMRQRGLIDAATYAARKAAIESRLRTQQQSLAVASSPHAAEDQDFIDEISDQDDV